jgi:hypothetical protein
MPVITRSQLKNITNDMKVTNNMKVENDMKKKFISKLRKLLDICDTAQGKENKMCICLLVYQNINRDLPVLIEKYSRKFWIKFVATVFNKTSEFLDEAKQGNWINLDKSLVEEFNTELHKTRNFIIPLIKKFSGVSKVSKFEYCIIKAKEDIFAMEK